MSYCEWLLLIYVNRNVAKLFIIKTNIFFEDIELYHYVADIGNNVITDQAKVIWNTEISNEIFFGKFR